MKQIIGYYKKVGVGREYGSLTAYMEGNVTDIADANFDNVVTESEFEKKSGERFFGWGI